MASVIVKTGDEFAKVVGDILTQYSAGTKVVLEDTLKEVAKEASKKVKADAPKRTGAYKKSWTSKTESTRLSVEAVVYAKAPHYRLTHLLEKSHLIRNGTRSYGYTNPEKGYGGRVHIAPVNDWAQKEAVDRFVRKMESY